MISLIKSFFGAITFYTIIPIPVSWELEFARIARWAPLIGVLLGGILGLIDLSLSWLGIPSLTRSALIIGLWLVLTGGLHLDGVIDTADGLAVTEPQKRLDVMKDSVTGAFGVMAGVVVLLLKTTALSDISVYRCLALMSAATWGRWGQVVAIASYPYIRATGKGAFHKESLKLPKDVVLGLIVLLCLNMLWILIEPSKWWLWSGVFWSGCVMGIMAGIWFNWRLGGHTGDTYGAVVEWTEAIYLCLLTALMGY